MGPAVRFKSSPVILLRKKCQKFFNYITYGPVDSGNWFELDLFAIFWDFLPVPSFDDHSTLLDSEIFCQAINIISYLADRYKVLNSKLLLSILILIKIVV